MARSSQAFARETENGFWCNLQKKEGKRYDLRWGPCIKRDLSYRTKRLLSRGCHPVQLKRVEYGKGIDDFQKDVKQQEQGNHMTVNESFIYLKDTVKNSSH